METPKQTVLLVDDAPANIRLLSAVLGPEHELLFATSGREALEMATAQTPDLILLDVMMPELNGYEVCARLKAEPRTRSIPVICVTAMGRAEDEAQGLEVGAIDDITKPFSPPIIRARVRNHLELKRYRDVLWSKACGVICRAPPMRPTQIGSESSLAEPVPKQAPAPERAAPSRAHSLLTPEACRSMRPSAA